MFKRKRTMAPEAKEAMEIAARISEKADLLMNRLLRYQQSKNPLMTLMSDLYTQDQVKQIYHGPNGHLRP